MSGNKVNSKKSVGLLYSNNKETEKEIRETSPFTIATNDTEYFGVTLTKKVKYLFNKNFKPLKKLKRITEKWKISHDYGYIRST